jgi:hypothetical protein
LRWGEVVRRAILEAIDLACRAVKQSCLRIARQILDDRA